MRLGSGLVLALPVVLAMGWYAWSAFAQLDRYRRTVEAAPPLDLELFEGGSFRLSEQRGKLVFVNFWASWCGPCADEMPALQAAYRRNSDKVTFVGVNVQDTDSDAQAFLKKYAVTYPNGSQNSGPISIQYGMRGVPETYFIAPDGRLVRKWNTLTAADLEQFLAELQRASGAASRGG
jgi:cytochrome c biogenesis protein CcmG/thiol:disulfide interchange protein DsbE